MNVVACLADKDLGMAVATRSLLLLPGFSLQLLHVLLLDLAH